MNANANSHEIHYGTSLGAGLTLALGGEAAFRLGRRAVQGTKRVGRFGTALWKMRKSKNPFRTAWRYDHRSKGSAGAVDSELSPVRKSWKKRLCSGSLRALQIAGTRTLGVGAATGLSYYFIFRFAEPYAPVKEVSKDDVRSFLVKLKSSLSRK
jgi:hypothetical protein